MPRIFANGTRAHVRQSRRVMARIVLDVLWRRATRRPLAPDWSIVFEVGVLFWRAQFTRAMAMTDMDEGRACFDSLQTWTDECFDVSRRTDTIAQITADWITPGIRKRAGTLLYLHGGGYTFDSVVTDRMADLLCHDLGIQVLAPRYRLTPEHTHPAQLEDAMASYAHVLAQGITPDQITVIGDSAGGHLTLMLLQALQDTGQPQPALAIGLCPWTDIGDRGASLRDNNRFDLVQGWMALQFGDWLVGDTGAARDALSPIHHDYAGLAPLYLQAGGREVLVDMIRDFSTKQAAQGAQLWLDIWPTMVHDFQAHGRTIDLSAQALDRIAEAIDLAQRGALDQLPHIAQTQVSPNAPAMPFAPQE